MTTDAAPYQGGEMTYLLSDNLYKALNGRNVGSMTYVAHG